MAWESLQNYASTPPQNGSEGCGGFEFYAFAGGGVAEGYAVGVEETAEIAAAGGVADDRVVFGPNWAAFYLAHLTAKKGKPTSAFPLFANIHRLRCGGHGAVAGPIQRPR